MLHSDVLFNKL